MAWSLKFPSVQTWATARVTSYLSSQLKTTVSVGSVNIEFIRSVVLTDVFIQDDKHDTLIFARELKATVALQTLFDEHKKLILDQVDLANTRINLTRSKQTRDMNFRFLADYFASGSTDTSAADFYFAINKIKLRNAHFTYRDFKWDDKTKCIDFEDVDATQLNATIINFKPAADSLTFYADNISLKEKSGFVINNFSSFVSVTPRQMIFNKVVIKTPYSDVRANQYSMSYNSLVDFEEYITKVMMRSDFEESILSSNDIQYFASELFGLNQTIRFKGQVRGTVDNLKGKKLLIEFGKNSFYNGDASLNGLPDINTTFLNLDIKNLTTNKADVESIKQFPFTGTEYIQLPANLAELGNTTFKGVFTGFYNDFVAYGNIQTAIGYLSSDVNLKFNEQMDKSTYSGKLTATGFDLGKFWSLGNKVGKVSFSAQVKGSGFTSAKVNAKLSGNISNVELNGYAYKNITVDGDVAKKLFNGTVKVDDNNINLDFKGSVDFREKQPVFNFYAIVKNAALDKLNIVHRDTAVMFSADAALNMRGFNFDEFDGNFSMTNVVYTEGIKNAKIDKLDFTSAIDGDERLLNLRSDVLDVALSGKYVLSAVPAAFAEVLNKFLPPFIIDLKKVKSNQSATFNFVGKIKDVNKILDIFIPGLSLSQQTVFNGNVDMEKGRITSFLSSPWIYYNNILTDSVSLTAMDHSGALQLDVHSARVKLSDSLVMKNIFVNANSRKSQSSVQIQIENDSISTSKLTLNTEQKFLNGNTLFHVLPSQILVQGQTWIVNPANQILFDSTGIRFTSLTFTQDTQQVNFAGVISKKPEDKLRLSLTQFNSSLLNQLLNVYDVSLGGRANGYVDLAGTFNHPILTGDMSINKFVFNGDTLGNAAAKMDWGVDKKRIHVDGSIEQNGRNSATISGDYIIKPKNDEIDFNVDLQKISVVPIARYLSSFASKVKGLGTAKLHLYGPAKSPLLTGTARVQRGSMLVDYLNIKYTFSTDEDIVFTDKYMEFNKVSFNDEFGNNGMLNGKIYHDHLDKFVFNLTIDADRLYCLNTTAINNELFYGKGFGTGSMSIKGDINILSFKINLRSEKGTQIFIPLSNPEEITQSNFITFINKDTANHINVSSKIDLSGINMDFQLEATPDAEVQLLFDSKIGDVMKGNGSGNLRMLINTAGDFKMYGDYNIESGDYLFTLQNIVNKRFRVQDGIIRWAGSPYDATIDIDAKYNLRASTYDLLPDSTNRNRVPVEVLLHLKNNLMSPDVVFDIDVPNAVPAVKTSLKSVLNNEREMNRQVFSLLVLNRFSSPEGKATTEQESSGNAVGQNLGEFVSQQLSNWASQLSDKFNIGVNYRPGDALNKDEFDVSIATELFRNRVAVESNIGVANGTNQTSSIIGDFNVEFKINRDGNLRAKAFNKTNSNNLTNNLNSQYTQGIGVFYRQEFDVVSDLVRFRKNRKKNAELSAK